MASAAEIARQALEAQERPKRERAAEEARKRQELEAAKARGIKRAATRRFNQSDIPSWFPVEWIFVESWSGKVRIDTRVVDTQLDVWESGKDDDRIRLGLLEKGQVLFLDPYPESVPGPYYHTQGRWQGTSVDGPAAVARALRSYQHAMRMPDYLP